MINFLKDYILSLKERDELDWLVYQLIQAKEYIPLKTPFTRKPPRKLVAKRGEAEHGIDISCFKDKEQENLIIFVLKDEPLTATTWKKGANFQADLMDAVSTNFENDLIYKHLKTVDIILVYNKDENSAGKKSFDDFVKKWSSPSKAYDREIPINIIRWNIDNLTNEIEAHIPPSEILPWKFNSFFNYLCTQAEKFKFNSEEWNQIFIPSWKDFLDEILGEEMDEKKIRLVNLCLSIFKKKLEKTENNSPLLIDITEWAILKLSGLIFENPPKNIKNITYFYSTTLNLYRSQLENYINENENYFKTVDVSSRPELMGLGTIHDSYLAHWNIARLGILALLLNEINDINKSGINKKSSKKEREAVEVYDENFVKNLHEISNYLEQFIEKNGSTKRPLVDLDHIQVFLIWFIFYTTNKESAFYSYLSALGSDLTVRAIPQLMSLNIPFIESHNRLDLVAEYAGTGKKPLTFSCKTSYFLMVALELSFSLQQKNRDEVIEKFYRQIIHPTDLSQGKGTKDRSIDLTSWHPPENWESQVFKKSLVRDGVGIPIGNFESLDAEKSTLPQKVEMLVKGMVDRFDHIEKFPYIRSLKVLACLKQGTPLPPPLWRTTIFVDFFKEQESSNENTSSNEK